MMARQEAARGKEGFVRFLQGWIGIVGFMAFGNTVSCFLGHAFLAERLYTGSPEQVNPLAARLFGAWTILAGILRVYCSFNIRNKPVYNLTFISFVVVLVHFLLEIFCYKTCRIDAPGVIAPIVVSGVSIVSMVIGYSHIYKTQPDPREDDMKAKYTELLRGSKKAS